MVYSLNIQRHIPHIVTLSFDLFEKGNGKISQTVCPLPLPAATYLRYTHMSHALVTAVGGEEMG